MKIVIRADASVTIGSGHIMRTLELARRFRDIGMTVVYLCKRLEGNLAEMIRKQGFEVEVLESDADESVLLKDAMGRLQPCLLIIDHYGIDAKIEASVKKLYRVPMLCYDDTFSSHACDLVLNPNIYASAEAYREKVPASAVILAGSAYATIREEFRRAKAVSKVTNALPRLLVTLGGSDPDNVTSRVLETIGTCHTAWEVTVVIGPANRYQETIVKQAKQLPSCHVIVDPADMAALMRAADFAITAAGQTTIEALYMELPTINVMIAENQRLISGYMDEKGLSVSLKAGFSPEALCSALDTLVSGRAVDHMKLAAAAGEIGTRSVVDAVRYRFFKITPAREDDIVDLYELANDPVVRNNSFSTTPIAWDEHQAWFSAVMTEPLQQLYCIRDMAGIFMGQLRFDSRCSGKAVISISIIEAARGYGIASQVIRRGVMQFFEGGAEEIVEALVKKNNAVSLKSFERAGFQRVQEDADAIILQCMRSTL